MLETPPKIAQAALNACNCVILRAGYTQPSEEAPLGEIGAIAGAFNPCSNFYG